MRPFVKVAILTVVLWAILKTLGVNTSELSFVHYIVTGLLLAAHAIVLIHV